MAAKGKGWSSEGQGCSPHRLTALGDLSVPETRGNKNKCPKEGGLVPSDPHTPFMRGLYQAFYGSYLPIDADSPCLVFAAISSNGDT